MRDAAASQPRRISGALVLVTGAIAAVAAAAVFAVRVEVVGPGVLVFTGAALAHRRLLRWRSLLIALILVILFIPIRRYTMPGHLPFQLEPYRLLVLLVALGWGASLLADPRVKWRPTGLDAPIGLLVFAAVASDAVNAGSISANGVTTEVVKALMFFLSYFVIVYVIASVLRGKADVDVVVRILVAGAAVLAVFAVYENRTGYNAFDHLPLLRLAPDFQQAMAVPVRGARVRATASAQHPIALGAAFALLLPLAIYLGRRSRRWWIAATLLLLGVLTTQSRTAIVMLLVSALVYLWLRPRQTRRLWPALLPLLAVIHVALPATLGPLKDSFFPKGGLIANQSTSKGTIGEGRIADLGPGFAEWSHHPVFGVGYASHIVNLNDTNDPLAILDDQWLGTLLDTGALGIIGLGWLMIRFVRRCSREAKHDDSDRAWLFVALTASIASFAIGMFTFDAFAFIQVTFLALILIGLGAVLLAPERERASSAALAERFA